MKKFREFTLKSGTEIELGKDAESNDELMKKLKGKENTILHTVAPGSPFCVIKEINPSAKDILESGIICARYSQDWRDNKKDVKMSIFIGKDIKKERGMDTGTWAVRKARTKTIKKKDIEDFLKSIKSQ